MVSAHTSFADSRQSTLPHTREAHENAGALQELYRPPVILKASDGPQAGEVEHKVDDAMMRELTSHQSPPLPSLHHLCKAASGQGSRDEACAHEA